MKKTVVITFRTDSGTKDKLAKIAVANKCSIAQVVDEILHLYLDLDLD